MCQTIVDHTATTRHLSCAQSWLFLSTFLKSFPSHLQNSLIVISSPSLMDSHTSDPTYSVMKRLSGQLFIISFFSDNNKTN